MRQGGDWGKGGQGGVGVSGPVREWMEGGKIQASEDIFEDVSGENDQQSNVEQLEVKIEHKGGKSEDVYESGNELKIYLEEKEVRRVFLEKRKVASKDERIIKKIGTEKNEERVLEKREGKQSIERILKKREVEGQVEYLIKWADNKRQQDTFWVLERNLSNPEKIEKFENKRKAKKKNIRENKLIGGKRAKVKCQICNRNYRGSCIARHMVNSHKVSSLDVVPCKYCDEWFMSLSDMEEHMTFHDLKRDRNENGCKKERRLLSKTKLYCKICKYVCVAKDLTKRNTVRLKGHKYMKEHIEMHNKIYQCDQCEKSYTDNDNFKRHLRVVHSDIIYNCDICEFKVKQADRLKEHILIHEGEFRYPCDKCGGKYVTSSLLRRHHKNVHPATPPVICELCKKVFKRRKKLDAHITNLHLNERPYHCEKDMCNKQFSSQWALNNHLKNHAALRQHVCEVCPSTFKRYEGLTRHMSIHTGERHHICLSCGKGFIQKGNLLLHSKICV